MTATCKPNGKQQSASSETLLTFPCRFPIKAMGSAERDIPAVVLDIIGRHAPDLRPAQVRRRSSASGKWQAVTVVIEAKSKAQLDAIYQDLTAHEAIVYAL